MDEKDQLHRAFMLYLKDLLVEEREERNKRSIESKANLVTPKGQDTFYTGLMHMVTTRREEARLEALARCGLLPVQKTIVNEKTKTSKKERRNQRRKESQI